MSEPPSPASPLPVANEAAFAPVLALPQRQKLVLVMDLVESVRLMEANEQRVIELWRGFVRRATEVILPRHRGRLVKSLGDGIMAEFESARDGVAAALELHRLFDATNERSLADERLYLRAGLHATRVFVDASDIYGSGVNLAARVAALAGPGETMVTAEVRDSLVDGLDAGTEDMGECHLKHVSEPVHVYRVGPRGPSSLLVPITEYQARLKATIAVIPLECRSHAPEDAAVGDLVADAVINQLARSGDLRVLSRLSTSSVQGRHFPLDELQRLLHADYVLSGSYVVHGDKVVLSVELASTRTQEVLWSDRLQAPIADLLLLHSETLHHVANHTHLQIMQAECAACMVKPLPTLPSYSIMLASVRMMHRLSRQEFERAHALLEYLCERHPRIGTPSAWIGNWYTLRAAQGWNDQPEQDLRRAKQAVERALAVEPSHSLALTVRGQIAGYVERDYETAARSYQAALEVNPNEPLAWLYRATLAAWTGGGREALTYADNALMLSPVDPIRYYFESLAAVAHLSAGEYESAIRLARSSLRKNRMHTSTHKVLVMALSLAGQREEAERAARQLLELEPGFTLERFLSRSPLAGSPDRLLFAEAFRAAGIPQN